MVGECLFTQTVPLALRGLVLVAAVLMWWRLDGVANRLTHHTPRLMRAAVVVQYVAALSLIGWSLCVK